MSLKQTHIIILTAQLKPTYTSKVLSFPLPYFAAAIEIFLCNITTTHSIISLSFYILQPTSPTT